VLVALAVVAHARLSDGPLDCGQVDRVLRGARHTVRGRLQRGERPPGVTGGEPDERVLGVGRHGERPGETALDLSPKKETIDGKAIISYPATISANNPDGALRPGMSANAMVIIAQARNALVVPNQALTFSPPPDIEAKYPKPKMSVAAGQQPGRVWVLNGEDPEPRDITLGLTDGRITQIAAGSLRAGEKIIINTIH
jgi:multidrug efflux pump subunit AcrA (membrane-fusion protein)